MEPIKAEQLGSAKWRVLAIPFGGPFKGKDGKGRDLDGEFFSERTDIFGPYKNLTERPAIFHHALDEELEDESLGIEDDLRKSKEGWWGTLWLDRSNQYWSMVNALLQRGKMYGSSGTIPQFMRKDKATGEILKWPHLEQTLTPTPSNFFSRLEPMKALKHFQDAGIAVDAEDRALLAGTADLGPDLPPGGEDLAKLVSTLDTLEEVLRGLRR